MSLLLVMILAMVALLMLLAMSQTRKQLSSSKDMVLLFISVVCGWVGGMRLMISGW